MKNAHLDRHHVSHEPPVTMLIPHRKHQEIHGNTPIINELALKMRQYDALVKFSVMVKNWTNSYRREFNEEPIDVGLEQLEKKKRELLEEIKAMIRVELMKVKHIKGLGPRFLAGLLAYAHPCRFPNVGRFLYYCGYTKASKITNRYNRKVAGLVYQITKSLIRHKNEKYYELYIKIKSEQPSSFLPIKKHRIAMNRVGTLFLKDFYHIFKEP
jgi:hypothetical protein